MNAVVDLKQPNLYPTDTGAMLLERARALVPMLQERAVESERLRRLAPESFEALRDAGLLKLYAPRRHGGFALTPLEAVRIYAEIARGDGAAAWVTMIMSTNSWMAAQFHDSVQATLFEGGDIRVVGVIGGGGGKSEARKVDGGYLLSGFWPFCSGCHYAKWVMLGAAVAEPDDAGAGQLLFAVPQDALTIKDDWHTSALTGSGSNSVMCKEVFVPSEQAIDLAAAAANLDKDPLYRMNFVNLFAYQLVGPALGFARAAVEHFVGSAPKRGIAYTNYEKQVEAPVAQVRLGEAMVKIAAATALAERDLEEMMANTLDEPVPLLRRGERRANASYVARLCLEAVETIFLSAGASSILQSNPLQRIARDIHADNMHGALVLDTSLELLGRLRFGLEPNTYVI
ncbi:MAG: acyl-CoA dehydrogenase family protein [Sphingobium sp.]|nr:acyl-CoA dehydrogenase family protein [Sphingobium sp.]